MGTDTSDRVAEQTAHHAAAARAANAGTGTGMTGRGHAAAATIPPPAPLRAGERFVRVTMPRPYTPTPPPDATDEYRCFLIDPKLKRPTFLTGTQFLPQNAAILHHAIFFRAEPADVASARQLDAAEPGDGWRCFGGTRVGGSGPLGQLRSGAAWVGAWAPGGHETLLDRNIGYRMDAGSQIVMQVHYNLLATGGKPDGTDQSSIRLRVVDNRTDLDPLQTTLLPAPIELPCLAGESGPLCDREASVLDLWHRFGPQAASTVGGLNLLCNADKPPKPGPTQSCMRTARADGTIYAVAGHMHLLGRSIKVELNPGTPKARTLLDVPTYNFDDQNAHPLAKPVQVKAGDTYRVTCKHDATLRKQLPELRPLKPRYVVWGEGTSDEMCLGIVLWAARS